VQHERAQQYHAERLGADQQRRVGRRRASDAVAAEHERQRVADDAHGEEPQAIGSPRAQDHADVPMRDGQQHRERDDGPDDDDGALREAAERDLRQHVRGAADEVRENRDRDRAPDVDGRWRRRWRHRGRTRGARAEALRVRLHRGARHSRTIVQSQRRSPAIRQVRGTRERVVGRGRRVSAPSAAGGA
jgi:hypothetical protein